MQPAWASILILQYLAKFMQVSRNQINPFPIRKNYAIICY